MGLKTAREHNAAQDTNDFPTLTAVSGTVGTADTAGTAEIVRIGADPSTGALYVNDLSSDGGTNVNITTGTVNRVHDIGTLGSIANVGAVHTAGTVSALPDLPGGTIDLVTRVGNLGTLEVGTVGNINAIGTLGTLGIGSIHVTNTPSVSLPDPVGSVVMTVGTVSSLPNVTLNDIAGGTIDLVTRTGNVGTLELGSVVVNSITAGDNNIGNVDIVTLPDLPGGTLDAGTIHGGAASGAAASGNPVHIAGTDSGGSIYAMLVDTAGNPQVDVVNTPNVSLTSSNGTVTRIGHVGTIESMPAVGGGTQFAEDAAHTTGAGGNLMLGVRVDSGTSLVSADLDYAPFQVDANGGVRVAGTVAASTLPDLPGGTVDLLSNITTGSIANIAYIHEIGTMPAVGGGTQFAEDAAHTTGAGGNLMLGVRVDSGTSLVSTDIDYAPFQVDANGAVRVSGTQAVSSLPDLPGGTIDSGTVVIATNNADLPGGTVDLVTTVSNLTNGSVRMTVGTVTVLPDLPGGTVDLVTTVTTVTDVTDVTNVTSGTLARLGTVQNLDSGTLAQVTSVSNVADGTVHQDSLPVRTLTSYGTLGTTGAAVFGTILAAVGAGTQYYLHGLSMVVTSGTLSTALMNGTSTNSNGAGVFARGNFVPGGGIVRDYTTAVSSGTNGTLVYWMSGAGTAYFTAQYFVL